MVCHIWRIDFKGSSCHLVAKSYLTLHGLQHARLPCPSLAPGVCSNSYFQISKTWISKFMFSKFASILIQWCHPTISFSFALFSPCPQSFPASRSFPKSWLFASGDQSIGASGSTSVLSVNIRGWFPLGLTGLISLLFKGLSRILSSTTIQEHWFFHTQPSLWSNSLIRTWLLEKS